MTTVLAPGKLMIAGEYAVLDGAPAIVLAVDRGVRCVRTDAPDLHIETPTGDDRFVRPAVSGTTGTYQFSNWNPTNLPDKPGFGGSAAACVAACISAGRPATDAISLHHKIQGGGSGVDVAASIHGGMIKVHQGVVTPLTPLIPVVIWSGKSASTQPLVTQYLTAKNRSAFVSASTDIVNAFSDNPIDMLQENGQLLMHMGVETGVQYMTPALAGIRKLAREFGGAAKPSGAGGGDCAIALFPDPDSTQAFISACEERGRTVIPIKVAGPAAVAG